METLRTLVVGPSTSATINLTAELVRADGIEPEVIALGTDPTAYSRLLRDTWAQGEGFVLVEHDVLAWPGALGLLMDCPEPWCGHSYWMNGRLSRIAFGCTKFGALLVRGTPGIWDNLDPNWRDLDTRFGDYLDALAYHHHRHDPPVVHLNPRHWSQNLPSAFLPVDELELTAPGLRLRSPNWQGQGADARADAEVDA